MPAVSSRPQVLSKLQDVPPSPLELMELVKSIDEDGAWIVFCGVRFRTLIVVQVLMRVCFLVVTMGRK
jgi:hypothetical protein